MGQLLRCAQPAVIMATDHLFDLVEQAIERHCAKSERKSRNKVAESLVTSQVQAYWTALRCRDTGDPLTCGW